MAKIVVLIGVAGSGKTTVGTMLADAMRCAFLEGDALHSAANVEKMSHGIPLSDADRAPWLVAIHNAETDQAIESVDVRRLLAQCLARVERSRS